jgi:hypothetical protein
MEIRADLKKNRLYLKLTGFVSDAELVRRSADPILEAAKRLRPGFDIITDLSEFRALTADAAEQSQKTQDALAQLGVGRVVRVSPSALPRMQLARTSKHVYTAIDVTTMEEAERLLDEAPSPASGPPAKAVIRS